ncbi:MAG: nucleotidyl transferase AbiEii/AbiGii toxin family protein [Bacteroidaceae bacterium]|nr:nucleotidyl transferase AbiEii/AbiGii toxin family protein [Bacteroidaceae bacterium]
MLSIHAVNPHTLELLKDLSARLELDGLRLVGGTSLALQYGHRQSIDLDFFGHINVEQDELVAKLSQIGSLIVTNKTPHILQTVINNVKVDFVEYGFYKWIDQPILEDGFCLASDKDIAAMKINAIMGRGSKKDFIDLFVLLQHYDLSEILNFYKLKYPEYSEYRALLSMTYFNDAEMQDTPILFIQDSWEDIKRTIIDKVKNYQK